MALWRLKSTNKCRNRILSRRDRKGDLSTNSVMASTFRWGMWEFSTRSLAIRWPETLTSYITPRWSPRRLMSGLMSLSIVDELVWGVVTAFESVALVSMLCFFFLFCGCTI
ncbi:hypothetical protein VNO77_13724 [Canavalia gladiata]|uniref:Uncharacterized protein n=1 Tax=Canavalia gladiata TaxID=3824 RepID=A0AAN9QQF9_CANGL